MVSFSKINQPKTLLIVKYCFCSIGFNYNISIFIFFKSIEIHTKLSHLLNTYATHTFKLPFFAFDNEIKLMCSYVGCKTTRNTNKMSEMIKRK